MSMEQFDSNILLDPDPTNIYSILIRNSDNGHLYNESMLK